MITIMTMPTTTSRDLYLAARRRNGTPEKFFPWIEIDHPDRRAQHLLLKGIPSRHQDTPAYVSRACT